MRAFAKLLIAAEVNILKAEMIAALLLEMAASLALTMPAELAEDWTALAWLLSPKIVLLKINSPKMFDCKTASEFAFHSYFIEKVYQYLFFFRVL